jgi:hypothetical protein
VLEGIKNAIYLINYSSSSHFSESDTKTYDITSNVGVGCFMLHPILTKKLPVKTQKNTTKIEQ